MVNGAATRFAIGAPTPVGLGRIIDSDADRAYSVAFDEQVRNELTGKGISGQMDWDWGGAQFTSITAYREQSDTSQTDADFSAGAIITNPQERDFETFTQEIRLASTGDNTVDWLIGGFYFDEDVTSSRDVIFGSDARGYADSLVALLGAPGALGSLETALGLPVGGAFFAPGTGVFGQYQLDNVSYSLFGQLDFHLTERLTLSGGIAYLDDKKKVNANSPPPAESVTRDKPHVLNCYVAGYIGYLELVKIAGRPPSENVRAWLRETQGRRAAMLEMDPRQVYTTEAGGFLYLVPEFGEYLHEHALPGVATHVSGYNDLAPLWFLSEADEVSRAVARKGCPEGSLAQFYDYASLFAAKAFALKVGRQELEKYLDVPGVWRGDLFNIHNLVATIEARDEPRGQKAPRF